MPAVPPGHGGHAEITLCLGTSESTGTLGHWIKISSSSYRKDAVSWGRKEQVKDNDLQRNGRGRLDAV